MFVSVGQPNHTPPSLWGFGCYPPMIISTHSNNQTLCHRKYLHHSRVLKIIAPLTTWLQRILNWSSPHTVTSFWLTEAMLFQPSMVISKGKLHNRLPGKSPRWTWCLASLTTGDCHACWRTRAGGQAWICSNSQWEGLRPFSCFETNV